MHDKLENKICTLKLSPKCQASCKVMNSGRQELRVMLLLVVVVVMVNKFLSIVSAHA